MKRISISLLLIIFASCKSLDERNEEDIENMPKVFQPYVRQFLKDASEHNKKIKLKGLCIEFSDGELYSNGKKCNGVYYHSEHKILIYNSDLWHTSPKSLLYHELGHALLDRDHRNGLDQHNQRKSIMHTLCINDYAFEHRTEYYLHELFLTE